MSGNTTTLDVSASGAGNVLGEDLTADSATVSLSGASRVELTVADTLSAEASGASTLRYRGSPHITRQEVSGASSIAHA